MTLSSAIWLVFVASRCAFSATSLMPRMQFRTLSCQPFTHRDQFGGQAKMSTWLTAIVINAARMKLRQRRPQAQISLDETHGEQNLLLAEILPDHQPNSEERCCRRELAERVADATTQLSPTLSRTFQLRDLYGLSIRETAHLLGVPGGTVKAQLSRGSCKTKGNSEKEPPRKR
jgi:RNA polymerase sigma-70 factor, ECF subfamily